MKEFIKKYYIYFIIFLLSLVAAINISVCKYALKTVNYNISIDQNNKIDYVYINDNKQALFLYENENIKYTEDTKTLTPTKYSTLTIKTSTVDKVLIEFEHKENVTITRDNINQELLDNKYEFNTSMKEVVKSSIDTYTILYTLIFIVIFLICFKIIKNTIKKINNEEVKIINIILFFISNFIIFLSTIYLSLSILKTLILIPIIFYLIILLYKIKGNLKLQNAYIILGTIVGLTFLFLIPPFHVPDESKHFMKSYTMLDNEYKDDNGIAQVNSNLGLFMTYYEYTALDFDVNFNGRNYLNEFLNNDLPSETHDKNYQNTKVASFVPYIPSAIMVTIGKFLKLSPLITFILGRMINLLLSFILCYLALKVIIHFNKILFVILLLPSFVQSQIGINMDSMTNAIAVLIIAYFIKLIYQKEKIDVKQLSVLFILGLILSFGKFGYFPIMLLGLLIPSKKIEVKKIPPILIKIVLILFVFIVSYKFSVGSGTPGTDSASPFYTISDVIQNPFNTMRIFINTFINRFDSDILRGQFDSFGTYTKYSNGLFLTFLTIMYAILLLMHDENVKKLTKKERIIYFGAAIMLILLPCVAMFLCWTEKQSTIIAGLQPRYFLIAMIPFYIGLSNNILNIKIKNKNLLYTICMVIGFTISLYTIAVGFY